MFKSPHLDPVLALDTAEILKREAGVGLGRARRPFSFRLYTSCSALVPAGTDVDVASHWRMTSLPMVTGSVSGVMVGWEGSPRNIHCIVQARVD